MTVNESLQTIFEKLEKFFHTETVVGTPITVGEITLVPIIEISFGLGSGGGSGNDGKGNENMGGAGVGAGVGAKIMPNAILVIKGEEVSLIPLKERGSLEKVLEMAPDLIKKIKGVKQNSTSNASTSNASTSNSSV